MISICCQTSGLFHRSVSKRWKLRTKRRRIYLHLHAGIHRWGVFAFQFFAAVDPYCLDCTSLIMTCSDKTSWAVPRFSRDWSAETSSGYTFCANRCWLSNRNRRMFKQSMRQRRNLHWSNQRIHVRCTASHSLSQSILLSTVQYRLV